MLGLCFAQGKEGVLLIRKWILATTLAKNFGRLEFNSNLAQQTFLMIPNDENSHFWSTVAVNFPPAPSSDLVCKVNSIGGLGK